MRDGLGVWDQQMQTIIYRMDKQQGPTVQHRELQNYIQYPMMNHKKYYCKKCIYIFIFPGDFPSGYMVKNKPAMQETQV